MLRARVFSMPKTRSRLQVDRSRHAAPESAISLHKLTSTSMKKLTQTRLPASPEIQRGELSRQVKKRIRSEVRGKVMMNRIRAKAELMASDLDENISDEVGELIGKLTTNFTDEESEMELTGYVFDEIRTSLLGEVKKQLK